MSLKIGTKESPCKTKILRDISPDEVDDLILVLTRRLKESAGSANRPSPDPKFARSVSVELSILTQWRDAHRSFNASDVDGPVWSAAEMAP